MSEQRSLVDVVEARAAERPGETVYTFVEETGSEGASVTWRDLDRTARAIGARLQAAGASGQRAVLIYPPGLDFISAFLGCLYGGTTAVPVHPPRRGKPDPRLAAIVADARPAVVLTTRAMREQVEAWAAQAGARIAVIASDDLADGEGDGWRPVRPAHDRLAFLQYTSGSTATPKGVMVTHGNLLHNEEAIRRAFGQSEQSVIVSWLPLYHDMGLIGGVLQPLYAGARCVLMSPLTFLQTPLRWLEAISRYRGTTSGGPNFAYELCIRKVGEEERARLDLSSWNVAFNGAEPVRADTLRRFAEAFAPAGFDGGAFRPCYGLAEATLLVSAYRAGRPATADVSAAGLERGEAAAAEASAGEAARTLVSCGLAEAGHRVVIVDPETRWPSAPGQVGEIWVSGPSVAAGYWNRPEASEEVFRARLADGGDASAFLRTGDLGFVRDGDLFVAGRLKDLIIVRGRNHHPHDIELTAERAHASVRPGAAAAFALEVEGEERLVVACEIERHPSDDAGSVAEAVRRAVSDEHQLAAHDVVLLRAGTLPKTSSGKIRRHACRQSYAAGEWTEIASTRAGAAPAGARPASAERGGGLLALVRDLDGDARLAVVSSLCRREVARLARVETSAIDPSESLTRLGVESLGAVELLHTVERELGISLPLGELLRGPSVTEVAQLIVRELESPSQDRPLPRLDAAAEAPAEYPLSYGQRALWFVQRLAPESGAYNVAAAARVRSALDVPALRRACVALVARHPALRSTFHETPGDPVQRVSGAAEIDFRVEDAAGWSEPELAARLGAEADRAFDLARGPLFRVVLFRDAEGGHRLLVVVHHIVTDFWTMRVLLGELAALYGQEIGGAPAELAPPAFSFAGHVAAERERLDGPEGERLWAYWSEQLRGAPRELELATDHPRGRTQGFRGASEFLQLPAELSEAVRAFARARGVTAHAVLLAAYQVLLHRYSGQRDLLVGVPAAGRTGPDWAGVAGYFVNPLPIRARFDGDPRFDEVVAQAQAATVAALEHQSYPFPLLAQRLQPERDPARPPLVQAVFTWHAPDADAALGAFALGEAGAVARLGGLTLESMRLERGTSSFDLSLGMSELGGRLIASLQYDADLFEQGTAAGLLRHLERLLAEATANPERRTGEIDFLSGAERARLLGESSPVTHPHAFTHELFARQAAATPERTALVHGGQRVSYAELDARANRLAHWLRGAGAGPEVRVAVLLERTPEMVAALLAVLKSGAAYVPFDAANPAERLRYMLEDARVSLVLTTAALAERLPETAARVVHLDTLGDELERQPADAPESGVRPENLSHVIFTSGSTGRPKGVMIRHSSASVLLHWMRDTFTDGERGCALFSTSITFDVSVAEIFGTLCWGGTGVLVENALELARASEPVVYASMVPTAAAELLRTGGIPASLRTLNLGGEPVPPELAQGLYALGTVEKVGNAYGPTEDTTYTSFSLIPPGASEVRVGRPLPGTRAYVLDANLRPVPVGVVGELYLAGEGLSRGYAARPALTAERYLPDPFGPAGSRMYRVMDRVRWRADGELEYFGRTDQQVKIRGFRIELGEIGTVLGTHPAVAEAVVVARPHAGDKRLVAYVVAQPGAPADAAELRAHLEARLPAYMVPAEFVWLDRLPLTGSGKIDRLALPEPEWGQAAAESFIAPRTPTEELLAGIYAEVLGVERVGVQDSFFELGGHSLLATRVVSRVRNVLGAELPLPAVFQSPTVERLAAALEGARASDLPAVVPLPHAGEAPLSFAQERLWFLDHLQPGGSEYNLPAALRLRGALDERALEQSLGELVRRHESLRTTFASAGGEPVQVIHPAGEWALEIEDLSNLSADERETEAERRARDEAERPFDLAAGPLFRARLLRLGDGDHVLLLVIHHVVFDGWSTGVILRELGALYAAFAQGLPSPLAEPRLQYADYAGWQGEHLKSGRLDAQLAWWRERLAGAPAVLDLPTDRPRPNAPSHRGAVERLAVPAELAAQLRALGRTEGATPFMVLLAAFQLLLSRYSGQEDVVVGSPIAGRTRAELEGLVGFFVNTLALRTDLSGNPSFRELLGRVREVTLGAYAHQELPFERLVQEVAPERSLGHAPLFQVMLTLQNAPREELKLDGVEVEWLEIEDTAAKFDLSLFAAESGEALDLSLQYATDLLDGSTARQMLHHLHALLAGAAAHPDRRVSELEMLGAEERAQLVSEWAATPSTHPHAFTHELFARKAAATPERTALVHGTERVSYAELDARANRLAHWLRASGAGPEVRVAVLLERTPELIVSLLGVLKAGAAYVPFDVANPAERLAYMIEDAQVSLVLTTSALAERLPESAAAIVRLDAIAAELDRQPADAPETGVRPENLSHVIFTSGSTGRPKGVMIRHSSASVLLHWMRETVTDAERTCALFSTSTSFDVSVAEIFGTLCWGGTGVLVENALELADVSEPVTYASMVPTAAAELLRMG
ncbi:MAG TPA: amino acid adenylation domain-containing protein, partial [Longimicrobium sp.]